MTHTDTIINLGPDTERAAFETWAEHILALARDAERYSDGYTQTVWDAWRARAAQAVSPSTAELAVIRALIALAHATFLALEDSEEFEGDQGRCHSITGQDFDDVAASLDALDELPDDRPGYTLAPYGKAQWALRRLLGIAHETKEPRP